MPGLALLSSRHALSPGDRRAGGRDCSLCDRTRLVLCPLCRGGAGGAKELETPERSGRPSQGCPQRLSRLPANRSVPRALVQELEEYVRHRTSPLNRARDGALSLPPLFFAARPSQSVRLYTGSCCIDITVGGDKSTTLRFLGWLSAVKEITPGLGVFCRSSLSAWVEEWLKALEGRGLKYSTLVRALPTLGMPHSVSTPPPRLINRRTTLMHCAWSVRSCIKRTRLTPTL